MTDLEQQNLGERIGVLENEVKNVKEQNTTEHAEIKADQKDIKITLSKITDKLDLALVSKADKSELKSCQEDIKKINDDSLKQARAINLQSIGIILAMAGFIITLIIALNK